MSDSYTDRSGKAYHGTVAGQVRRREERETLEAEALATYRATARALVALCSRLAAGQLSGPDLLRRLVGDDAALVLRAAGIDPGPVQARRGDSAPVRHSAGQSRTAALWGSSPDHDQRVLKAITSGASDAELSAVRREVIAEHEERAASRQAHPSVMWRTRDGGAVTDGTPAVIGASYGPAGGPVQRSQVNTGVPELGSEEV